MDERSAELYDYFEDVQISIIFAYSAVESFANTAIPLSFKYERLNNKGIKEILSKENIERWCSTTEKTGDVLPLIFMMDSPKTTSFWPDFKKLEGLRNDIVHLKTSNRDINDEGHYLKVFFEDETYNAIKSAESIIRYFCNNRDPLPYFPCFIGMDGPVKISALEDVKLAEHLEEIRQD